MSIIPEECFSGQNLGSSSMDCIAIDKRLHWNPVSIRGMQTGERINFAKLKRKARDLMSSSHLPNPILTHNIRLKAAYPSKDSVAQQHANALSYEGTFSTWHAAGRQFVDQIYYGGQGLTPTIELTRRWVLPCRQLLAPFNASPSSSVIHRGSAERGGLPIPGQFGSDHLPLIAEFALLPTKAGLGTPLQ